MEDVRKNAIKCGMTEKEFRHSTLRDIDYRIEAYMNEKEYRAKEIEYQSWLTGIFVMDAIGCCFDKKHKYPENPLITREGSPEEISKKTGKSEAELLQEEQYFAMRVRQANANIARVAKQQGEE